MVNKEDLKTGIVLGDTRKPSKMQNIVILKVNNQGRVEYMPLEENFGISSWTLSIDELLRMPNIAVKNRGILIKTIFNKVPYLDEITIKALQIAFNPENQNG